MTRCADDVLVAALVAADISGRRAVVADAADRLGLSNIDDSFEGVEGLTTSSTSLVWTSPVKRERILQTVDRDVLKLVHRSLAESSLIDRRERAHHLVHATIAPNSEIASELGDIGQAVLSEHGPLDATAVFLAASKFATSSIQRADFLCDAGVAALQANDLVLARATLEDCLNATPSTPTATRAILALGATLAWGVGPGAAADRMRAFAVVVADEGLATGLFHAAAASFDVMAGRVRNAHKDAVRARADSPDPIAQVLSTSVWVQTTGILLPLTEAEDDPAPELAEAASAAEALTPTIDALLAADVAGSELPAHQLVSFALGSDRVDHADHLLARLAASSRRRGLVGSFASTFEADLLWRTGRWSEAASVLETSLDQEQPGLAFAAVQSTAARLLAFRGDAASGALAEQSLAVSRPAGAGLFEAWAFWALAVHAAALGDHQWALECHERIRAIVHAAGLIQPGVLWSTPDHIDALIAVGDLHGARGLTMTLVDDSHRCVSRWGTAAGQRALGRLDDDDETARSSRTRSVALFGELGYPFERARSQLAMAERLVSASPTDAARYADEAHRVFARLGAQPWAARCRTLPLERSPVPAESAETVGRCWHDDRLTQAELRVARAAVQGGTTAGLAAALFVSPKTIESHLGSIYRKLGLRNRPQLVRLVLASEGWSAESAEPLN